jgi:hypothetical protein
MNVTLKSVLLNLIEHALTFRTLISAGMPINVEDAYKTWRPVASFVDGVVAFGRKALQDVIAADMVFVRSLRLSQKRGISV